MRRKILSGCGVWDFPPCGPRASFPQWAEQEHDSRHIMFIVREPCLKTEGTRTPTAWEGKKALSFVFVCLTKLDWRSPLGYCVQDFTRLFVCGRVCERVKRREMDKEGGKVREIMYVFGEAAVSKERFWPPKKTGVLFFCFYLTNVALLISVGER